MRFLEFCSQVLPRPGQLVARRREVVIGTVLIVGLSLVAAVAPDALLTVDEPVSNWSRRQGSTDVWRRLSYFGAAEVYLPLSALAAIALWNRCRSLAIAWPVLTWAGIGANVILKLAVDRSRPAAPTTGVALSSYPSGHVIQATVLLGLLVPTAYVITRRTWAAWPAGLFGAIALPASMFSRVALGAHWPTDVLGGVLIGMALLIAADLVVDLHA